jgi:hypothetical protein
MKPNHIINGCNIISELGRSGFNPHHFYPLNASYKIRAPTPKQWFGFQDHFNKLTLVYFQPPKWI